MNKFYRVIYNRSTQTFQAVTEYARAHGKGSTGSVSASEPVSTAGKLIRFSLVMSGIMLSTLSFATTGVDLPTAQTNSGGDVNYCFYDVNSDTVICGDGTTSSGNNNNANGVVLGKTAQMTGSSAIAIGNGAHSTLNAVSIGRDAKATNNKDIAIGYNAGRNLNDKGSNFNGTGKVSYVAGSTLTVGNPGDVESIATHTNISVGDLAGDNATGVRNINVGKSAGTNHFGEDSVTIGTDANNFTKAKNVDGSNLARGDTFRARRTVAIGNKAMTYGEESIAIGNGASTKQVSYAGGAKHTTAENAIAVGENARAAGNNAIAQGTSSVAQGINDIVIGVNAKAEIDPTKVKENNPAETQARANGIAIGNSAYIGHQTGDNAIAIGSNARVIHGGNNKMAIGPNAISAGTISSAVGVNAIARGDTTSAYGSYTQTSAGFDSAAVGASSTTGLSGNNMVAVGVGAITNNKAATAIGSGNMSFGVNSTVIGATGGGNTARMEHALQDANMNDTNFSIVGGQRNTAIGNANLIGSSSHDNFVLGNQVKIGASSATVAKTTQTITGTDGNVDLKIYTPTFNNTKSVNRSVAIGQAASVADNDAIAIGSGATAGDATKAANATANAIAIGKGAKALGKQAISIGTDNLVTADNAGAIGDPSIISGAGSYTVGNDNAVGSTSTNVGAFGNNNQIGATATYDAAGKLQQADGLTDTAAVENSRAVGNKNYINTSNTYVLGSGVGIKDDGTVLGTVKNSVYLGDDSTIAAGAAVGTKNLDKEGVVGATTTAGDIGTVETATVAGVTYDSFAGKTALGAVSVGSAGFERRLMNVAAGEISTTSTDAINGSQLYMVAQNTLAQMPVVYTDTDGNKVYKQPDGSFVDSTGMPYTGDVIASMNNGADSTTTPMTLTNIEGNLNGAKTSTTAPTTVGTAPANVADISNNAATVGDVLNAGWNLKQQTGTATPVDKDFVKAYDTVVFADGNATTASVTTTADGTTSTIKYDVNVDNSTIKVNSNGELYADIPTPAAPKNTFHTNNSAAPVAASGTNNVDSVDGVGSATGGYSLAAGLGAQATAYRAQAVGQAAEAHGAHSVADGFLTKANRENAVAIGNRSVAGLAPTATTTTYDTRGGVNTVAIGNSAQAMTSQSIAIGNNAKVNPVYHGDDANNTFNTSKLYAAGIAIGNIAETEGLDSIALGSLTKAQSDVAIAVGRATQVTGFNSTGIGTANNISGTSSAAVGSSNTVATKDTFVLGSNVANTADNSVFLGKEAAYTAKGTTTDGIGAVTEPVTVGDTLTYGDFAGKTSVGVVSVGDVNAERRIQNVAAGLISATSTDAINGSQLYATNAKLGNVADTVVNNFGGDADLNPDGSIAYTNIGNTGKNTIHDAIQAATTVVKAGTNVFVNETTNDATGQTEYTVNAWDTTVSAAPDSAVRVTPTIDDNNRTRAYEVTVNTDSNTIKVENGQLTANTTSLNNVNGAVDTPANTEALATAGDIAEAINSSGFTLTAEGENGSLVNPGDTVDMNNTDGNIEITKAANSNDVTYNLAKNINLTDAGSVTTGNTVLNNTGLSVGDVTVTNAPITVNGTPVNNINQAINQTAAQAFRPLTLTGDYGTGIDNVNKSFERKLGETINIIGGNNGDNLSEQNIGVVSNNTDTLEIKLSRDLKDLNTAVFASATGQTVLSPQGLRTYTNNSGDLVEGPSITNTGINAGNTVISNVAAGTADTDAVNVSQLKRAQTVVEGDQGVTVTAGTPDPDTGATTYTVAAKTDGTTVTVNQEGNIAAVTSDITTNANGVATATTPASLATAGDIAEAINSSGFTLTAEGENGSLVNPGDTVDMNNTDGNIEITKAANSNDVTYNLAKNINLTDAGSVTTGNTVLNNTGLSVGDVTVTNAPITVNGTPVNNINQAINQTAAQAFRPLTLTGDAGTTERKLGETLAIVAGNATDTTTKNLKTTVTEGQIEISMTENPEFKTVTATNSITIGDTAGDSTTLTSTAEGLDVGGDKITNVAAGTADTDAVNVSQLKRAQTVVEGDQGVTVTAGTPDPDTGATTYTVAAKTDGTTVTVNQEGNIAAVTSDITTNANGVATATTPASLATAGDIAEAINSSGWKLAADGTTGTELINPSDTVTFKAGSDNLTVKRDGANITYDLAKDININSVQFNDGPKITNDGNNIKVGDKDGNATKITNVAAGDVTATSTDAVNGSQLYQAVNKINTSIAASKEEVKSADKSITVKTTQHASGANVYDVSVNVDGTTITKDATTGAIKANTTPLTTTDGKVNTPTNTDALATAGDITNAINNSGFKLTTSASDGTVSGTTEELVNPSETITVDAGKNIAITQNANKISVATKADVSFDSVAITNGPTINGDGINMNGDKITNLAAGTADTDAVNVSQLRDFAGSVNNSFNNLNHRINDVADDANAGVSSAMAMAALPQAYIPGKSMLTGGIASYNGEGAVAVGLSKLSDNGRWVLKVSGTADTQGNAGGAVGAGFHF